MPLAGALLVLVVATAGPVALHALTPKGCIADVGDAAGCGATAQGLNDAAGVAVSPDGGSVYAVSASDDAIVRFDRAPGGALTPAGCIADTGDAAGCATTAQGLDGAFGVAVSPDGASVYAVSFLDDAIVRFAREVPPACHDAASTGAPGATQTLALDCSGTRTATRSRSRSSRAPPTARSGR